MEIRRALSHSVNWVVGLKQVPALLELIDEQQIPVDICLTQSTGRVMLRAESIYCRRSGHHLKLEGQGNRVEIDLEQLAEARAVSRAAGSKRRISLELLGDAGTARFVITGPLPGASHASQVWHLVMESLLPDMAILRSQAVPGHGGIGAMAGAVASGGRHFSGDTTFFRPTDVLVIRSAGDLDANRG